VTTRETDPIHQNKQLARNKSLTVHFIRS